MAQAVGDGVIAVRFVRLCASAVVRCGEAIEGVVSVAEGLGGGRGGDEFADEVVSQVVAVLVAHHGALSWVFDVEVFESEQAVVGLAAYRAA